MKCQCRFLMITNVSLLTMGRPWLCWAVYEIPVPSSRISCEPKTHLIMLLLEILNNSGISGMIWLKQLNGWRPRLHIVLRQSYVVWRPKWILFWVG
jgi:hypothetical protein